MTAKKREEAVIKALQGDMPLVARPFLSLAKDAGLTEKAFLSEVKKLLAAGKLRSIRAIVRHRQAGYKANAMVAWQVPPEKTEAAGTAAAALPAVSHCYARRAVPGWPYNLYTMVHGRTKTDIKRAVAAISKKTGVKIYKALESRREFKKTSMTYY
jgi:siroheme decarboxylase